MLTGTVTISLVDAKRENMRHRVTALANVPTGARVSLDVGALAVEPEVVRAIALHERRLQIDVHGTPRGVSQWLEAMRTHMGEVLL